MCTTDGSTLCVCCIPGVSKLSTSKLVAVMVMCTYIVMYVCTEFIAAMRDLTHVSLWPAHVQATQT